MLENGRSDRRRDERQAELIVFAILQTRIVNMFVLFRRINHKHMTRIYTKLLVFRVFSFVFLSVYFSALE